MTPPTEPTHPTHPTHQEKTHPANPPNQTEPADQADPADPADPADQTEQTDQTDPADPAEQKWRIDVDRAICAGTGACTVAAPEHFAMIHNRAQPIRTEISPDDAVIDAAESCPTEAIVVRDAASGRIVAPEE